MARSLAEEVTRPLVLISISALLGLLFYFYYRSLELQSYSSYLLHAQLGRGGLAAIYYALHFTACAVAVYASDK